MADSFDSDQLSGKVLAEHSGLEIPANCMPAAIGILVVR